MNASTSRAVLRPARQAPRTKLLLPARPSLRPPPSRVATPRLPRRTLFSLPDITKLANLASAEEGETLDSDRDLQRFHSRKILPYSQAQLYSIVANVPSYSSFIPFCTASTIVSRRDGRRQEGKWQSDDRPFDVDAELVVGFGGMEERFISRVEGRPFESVTATAAKKSPMFKSLVTTWSFSPASELSPHSSASPLPPSENSDRPPNSSNTDPHTGPTLLTIDLAFAFVNPLHRIASQAVLPKVSEKMVEAFEQRCLDVWGRGKA